MADVPGTREGQPLEVELSRCESIYVKTHWVLVVMDQFTRRIIGFGVQAGDVDGVALCRMFNQAIATMGEPKCLSTDNDPIYRYHRWKANLRILDVEEIKSVPYAPRSHPFVERLIGTVRRECLDQTLFWNARDLERKLADFRIYYNRHRTHRSLGGVTPSEVAGSNPEPQISLNSFGWQAQCRGLYQLPAAA
jgi:transposase InsO family protein